MDVSPGEQLLDMVHISDVCIAYLKAFELLNEDSNASNCIYSVSTGEMTTLRNVVLILEDIFETKLNINWGGRSYRDREVMLPNYKYQPLSNWKPTINLKNGLKRFKLKFVN